MDPEKGGRESGFGGRVKGPGKGENGGCVDGSVKGDGAIGGEKGDVPTLGLQWDASSCIAGLPRLLVVGRDFISYQSTADVPSKLQIRRVIPVAEATGAHRAFKQFAPEAKSPRESPH